MKKLLALLCCLGLVGCAPPGGFKPVPSRPAPANVPPVMVLTEKDSGKTFDVKRNDNVSFKFTKPAGDDIFWRVWYMELDALLMDEVENGTEHSFAISINDSGKIAFELFDFANNAITSKTEFTFNVK